MNDDVSQPTQSASQTTQNKPHVKTLNPEVARKIAAGEVIDRPCAIVRELMDNAVDSGADSIAVEITGGGIEKIRIVDNGGGMSKEDLASCARPHATSKITSETDLLHLTTLGFRGEALSSMAAVSRLEITSGGWKMNASVTEDHLLTPVSQTPGTIVQTSALFENFPARRIFLKRPASETMLCRSMFEEKVLPRPDIGFTLTVDCDEKLNLPKDQTLVERFTEALNIPESNSLFYEIGAASTKQDWSFRLVIGEPSVTRDSRKQIFIYVNGRRIQEYGLMQAIEYGCQGYFPNGLHPVACLFVTMDSSLVDFNIHPAKREARFKDIAPLHHSVSTTVRDFFKQYTVRSILHEDESLPQNETFSFGDSNDFAASPSSSFAAMALSNATSSVADDTNTSTFATLDKRTSFAASPSFGTPSSSDTSSGISSAGAASLQERRDVSYRDVHRSSFDGSPFYGSQSSGSPSSSSPSSSSPSSSSPSSNSPSSSSPSSSSPSSNSPSSGDKRSSFFGNAGNTSFADGLPLDSKHGSSNTMQQPNGNAETNGRSNYINNNELNNTAIYEDDKSFHFIGSTLGTFLIAEKNDTLYIIDQHAADERLRYNALMEKAGERQALLVPYTLETSGDADDRYLEEIHDALTEAGFTCKNVGNGKWEFSSVPIRWTGTESDLAHDLLDKRINPKEMINAIAATTACRSAVKDGTVLDTATASRIAEAALSLRDPHCPHGRPIYTSITREQLFALVKRT